MSERSPRVFLVGAGPGNSGLLTVRAVECLARAEFLIHDKLVSQRILDLAPATAERLCVADFPGCHAERGPQIQRAMIEAARAGRIVVRLKGGDAFLFARGGEEAEALREAGIDYEIVPGVTAGLAAPAFAGIPLTHRLHASAVALIAGHEYPAKPGRQIDWAALVNFPGTLVVYMGLSRLSQIVAALLEHGKPERTSAAVIEWGTTGQQRIVEAPLGELPQAVSTAGFVSPALVVIGSVVSLRSRLAWFEQQPLFGKRVLVTRPRPQADAMARRLEELGAVPRVLPAIAIREPADWGPVDHALHRLDAYDWLVFTSANGVQGLIQRLRVLRLDLRALGKLQLAAIGPGTAEALRSYYLEPDLVPDLFRSENLAMALKQRASGNRFLLARADRGREVLREELTSVGAVDQVAVYRQVDEVLNGSPILEELAAGGIGYVTLTSSNIACVLLRSFDERIKKGIRAGQVKLVTISPVTSAVVREAGLPVAAEASAYTTEGVVEALIRLAGQA